jgi:putative hydrolase of the HAD superfamily
MKVAYHEIVRRHSRPMVPRPTGDNPVLRRLRDVRAVLLDIYGTMFISGSGDVGVAQASGQAEALAAALAAAGYDGVAQLDQGVQCLLDTIRVHHQRRREQGIEYPEVDIVEVWRECLGEMERRGWLGAVTADLDVRRLAVEYEVRTNPVWPMPGLLDCLQRLRAAGVMLGIISNAQFYTELMFHGLLGKTPEELGFAADLQFYSYRYLQAKPGEFLYRLAASALAKRNVAAQNIVYVGNDMLNDIQAARRVGFRTALFAGDQRSLRWRGDDPRVAGVQPDLVLTDLSSLGDCLAAPSEAAE